MNKENVGALEELILLTLLILDEDAYIIRIQEELRSQANRKTTMGTIHVALARLEKKGLIGSSLSGATKERGGRRKRVYQLTGAGKKVVTQIRETRNALQNKIPQFSLKLNHG